MTRRGNRRIAEAQALIEKIDDQAFMARAIEDFLRAPLGKKRAKDEEANAKAFLADPNAEALLNRLQIAIRARLDERKVRHAKR